MASDSDSDERWRHTLPPQCLHKLDADRNPERRANLCLLCRQTAGDPIARRMLSRRQRRRTEDGEDVMRGRRLAQQLDELGLRHKGGQR